MHLSRNCPFSSKTNPPLELPGSVPNKPLTMLTLYRQSVLLSSAQIGGAPQIRLLRGVLRILPFLLFSSLISHTAKVPPFFGDPPLSTMYQSTPKTISASKMQIGTLQNVIDTLQSAGLNGFGIEMHILYPLANLYFGGRQFAFWRLKLSWGCFTERGGPPKKVVL